MLSKILLFICIYIIFLGLAACGKEEGRSGFFADGLVGPRGLSLDHDGRILVAEGGAGRISRIDGGGKIEVLYDLIPYLKQGPEGVHVGVSSVVYNDSVYYYVVGEARAKGFREVYRLTPGDMPIALTGQDPIGVDPANPIMNPYEILAFDDYLLVSDSGANMIWKVYYSGNIEKYAEFDSINYHDSGVNAEVQAVPTGMTIGPDGALYVALLTGYPFPNNLSRVVRLEDINGDGDTRDLGEASVYASGFLVATDIAFNSQGQLFVTEYSLNMKKLSDMGFKDSEMIPGRVVKWDKGLIEIVQENVISPTSILIANLDIYITEEFAGRIRIIEHQVTN